MLLVGQDSPSREAGTNRQWWPHLVAVALLLLAALALLAPALLRGPYLGPYGDVAQTGLLHRPGMSAPPTGSSDLITEMIPWSALDWNQVHLGHLPLWNPYSGFGMPLAFNWQSSPFGLPALVGYLFPMRFAFTIGVIVTLMVAGTGTYVLGRVLGLGVIVSVMAGTFFELSGPFLGWLGYPLSAVISWLGWLLAAGILILRGQHRTRDVTFFAVILALSVYAGNPDTLVVLLLAVGVFLVALLAMQAWRGGVRTIVRPVASLALATLAGMALAAPLAFPGYQLGNGTTRVALGGHGSVSLTYLSDILLPNDFRALNLPILAGLGSHLPSTIGFIAVPFALAAVASHWRNRNVVALVVLVVCFVGLAFSGPMDSLVDHLPFVSRVYWNRALMPGAIGLAVLAGVGADTLIRQPQPRRAVRWLAIGFGVLAVWLVYAWFSRPALPTVVLAAAQDRAFLWPVICVAVGLIVAGALLLADGGWGRWEMRRPHPQDNHQPRPSPRTRAGLRHRQRVVAVVGLLGIQTAALVVTGSSLWQSSSTFLPTTPGATALQKAVGAGTIGLGPSGCSFGIPALGLPQETNVAYAVHEVGIYDPIIPRLYFTSWQAATGASGGVPAFAAFCPTVNSASVARRFGIDFVLTAHGAGGPSGGVFVRTVGSGASADDLYKIPGAAAATLTSAPLYGALPSPNAVGIPLAVSSPNPSTWKLTTSDDGSSELRLHLTDVPGWRATIDGKPLDLESFSGIMLQARIPPGHHTIVVTYWPRAFTVGLVLAVLAVLALGAALIISRRQASTKGRGV